MSTSSYLMMTGAIIIVFIYAYVSLMKQLIKAQSLLLHEELSNIRENFYLNGREFELSTQYNNIIKITDLTNNIFTTIEPSFGQLTSISLIPQNNTLVVVGINQFTQTFDLEKVCGNLELSVA